MKKKVILASGSKQRQDLLKMLGLKFSIMTSDIDEKSDAEDPAEYVKELSFNKATNVANRIKEKGVVIGVDTIIFCEGKVYEKPKTIEEAGQNIRELTGKVNTFYTGVTVIDLYSNKTISYTTSIDVKFKDYITESEIEWYLNNEKMILKYCGYVPLGKGAIFIDSVYNGDYNTMFGLSLSALSGAFKTLGYTMSDFEMENDNAKVLK